MKARAIVVNLRTVFLVYCPECHSTDRAESLLDADTVRDRHACREVYSLDLGELREVCRA